MSSIPQVGFSQRVRVEWLQETALLILAGGSRKDVTESLAERLKDKVSVGGVAERGNREKIISILLRTWLPDTSQLNPFRMDGLELLSKGATEQVVVIHWGMVSATYPFWANVGEQVGRLLALQGTVSALQIQRRMRELLGERETVSRATRRVLRSFLDWGVLIDTTTKGTYEKAQPIRIHDPKTISWILEAILLSRALPKAPFLELAHSHALFPFQLPFLGVEELLRHSSRIERLRHGQDLDLVYIIQP